MNWREKKMKKFLLRIPQSTYDRLTLIAKQYDRSINKTIIELLEIGYIYFVKSEREEMYK